MYQELREDRHLFSKRRFAVITLQAHWRKFCAAKTLKRLQARHDATVVIQRFWKSIVLMRKEKAIILKRTQACVLIQSAIRRYLVRNVLFCLATRNSAASRIQSWWKMIAAVRKEREGYLAMKKSVISIQAHIRGYLLRKRMKSFHRQVNAVKVIQQWWTASNLTRKRREEFLDIKRRIVIVQSVVRRFLVNACLEQKHQAVRVLQLWWVRCMKARKQRQCFLRLKQATIVLQCSFRCYTASKKFSFLQKRHAAARLIQEKWRATMVLRKQQQTFLSKRAAVIKIQAIFRCILMKEKFAEIIGLNKAAALIQTYWRATLLMRQERSAFMLKKNAVITIENAFRNYIRKGELRKLKRKRDAVVVIQQKWKATMLMKKQHTKYILLKHHVLFIQTTLRKFLEEARIKEHVVIQSLIQWWIKDRTARLRRKCTCSFSLETACRKIINTQNASRKRKIQRTRVTFMFK